MREAIHIYWQKGRTRQARRALGRWWGSAPRKKSEAEIDIVASDGEHSLLFCECKWTNEPVDVSVLETLVERSFLLTTTNRHYIVFSKSGFMERGQELAGDIGRVHLVTFADMI